MAIASAPAPPQARVSIPRNFKLLIGLASLPGIIIGILVVLRFCGLICPYSVPTGAMAPAVSSGDHIFMEGFTFLARRPRRGDIVVFRAEGIPGLPQDQIYVKRVAGEPGDRLKISDGNLYINGNIVLLSNAFGKIDYTVLPGTGAASTNIELAVPENCYYVLGDNSYNSLDSRYFGCIPRRNVKGRVAFCYWPSGRTGSVR